MSNSSVIWQFSLICCIRLQNRHQIQNNHPHCSTSILFKTPLSILTFSSAQGSAIIPRLRIQSKLIHLGTDDTSTLNRLSRPQRTASDLVSRAAIRGAPVLRNVFTKSKALVQGHMAQSSLPAVIVGVLASSKIIKMNKI